MTFIVNELEDFYKFMKDGFPNPESRGYQEGYLAGIQDTIQRVKFVEMLLEQRIWQAWKNEGVEPR